jgi:signal peptidase
VIVRAVRSGLDLVLIGLVLLGLATVVLARVVPMAGGTTLIVTGGSMEPTIQLGAVAIVGPTDPETLRPGDVVSIKAPGAAIVVTHRIVRVVERSDGTWLETRGDANAAADPILLPASAVVGRVQFAIPIAGRLMAALSRPGGLLVMFGLAGFLLASTWWLESLQGVGGDAGQRRVPPPSRRRRPASADRRRARVQLSFCVAIGALAAALAVGGAGAPATQARFVSTATAQASATLDTLGPPTSLTCNGGLTTCNAGLITRPALSWTATSDLYATGYRILRSTTSGSGYAQVGQVTGRTTTTWSDTGGGLALATTYYYVVTAYFDPWTSVRSNQVSATIVFGL